MFTGIIEELGCVNSIKKGDHSCILEIKGEQIFSDLNLGDSVAVNGTCLTVTKIAGVNFTVDVMNETLSRSSLGDLTRNSYVNLERAMPANGRFGGHIVTGHIDGVGKIAGIRRDDNAVWYTIKTSPQIMQYIIEKGSMAIDGISLTVAKADTDRFQVSVIPHTMKETILGYKRIGSIVNLENDMIGKYIEQFMKKTQGITQEFLTENGF